mgnify:CR=1 FL=1
MNTIVKIFFIVLFFFSGISLKAKTIFIKNKEETDEVESMCKTAGI